MVLKGWLILFKVCPFLASSNRYTNNTITTEFVQSSAVIIQSSLVIVVLKRWPTFQQPKARQFLALVVKTFVSNNSSFYDYPHPSIKQDNLLILLESNNLQWVLLPTWQRVNRLFHRYYHQNVLKGYGRPFDVAITTKFNVICIWFYSLIIYRNV